MPICQYCGQEFHYFLFKCKWCDMLYCLEHRLPENHKCIFKPSRKKNWLILRKKPSLYRESSDQLNDLLMPEEIYIGAKNKIINKSDAIEFLNAIIEHHNDIQLRVESIEVINKLAFKDKSVFKILENIIVSDDNVEMRIAAIKTLVKNFPKDCKTIVKWVIDNEKSNFVVKTLKDALKTVDNQHIKSLIKKLFNNEN
ncbi:MAG: AN1-type zinc finger domain-containing protein [Promethearchaeota archaeon]